MRRGRFTEDQIIGVLREHEAGLKTAELCRKHGISDATHLRNIPAEGIVEYPNETGARRWQTVTARPAESVSV